MAKMKRNVCLFDKGRYISCYNGEIFLVAIRQVTFSMVDAIYHRKWTWNVGGVATFVKGPVKQVQNLLSVLFIDSRPVKVQYESIGPIQGITVCMCVL